MIGSTNEFVINFDSTRKCTAIYGIDVLSDTVMLKDILKGCRSINIVIH